MAIENPSVEKSWEYFNPLKPEEELPLEVGLPAFMLQKFPIFSKTKQKTTQKLFV